MIEYRKYKFTKDKEKDMLYMEYKGQLNDFIRALLNSGVNGEVKKDNLHYFKLEKKEYLNELNNKIKDCLNFNSGFYHKMLNENENILLENKNNYTLLDEGLCDEYGKYIVIIYSSECYFGKRLIKLYYELNN